MTRKIENSCLRELDSFQLMLFKKCGFVISLTIFSIALIVLIGWYFDYDTLKFVNRSWASMKIQTATGFLFSGLSLLLLNVKTDVFVILHSNISRNFLLFLSSLFVFLCGFLVIVEYVTAIDLHIDFAGRMSLITAFNFFCYGIAFFLIILKHPKLFQNVVFIPLIISYVVSLNYLFGEVQYVQSQLFSIAVHTAFCFLILGIGLLLSQIESNFLRFMVVNTTKSIVFRLFFSTLIFVPFLCWLKLKVQKAGLFNIEFGLSLFSAAIILSFGSLIFWTAKKIDDNEREISNKEIEKNNLLKLIEESVDYIGMANFNHHLTYHNQAAKKMLGFPENLDTSNLTIKDVHPSWVYQKLNAEFIPIAIEQGFWKGETALLHRNGYEIPVLQTLICHKDRNGKPIWLSTLMTDISKQKEVEKMLQTLWEKEHSYRIEQSQFMAMLAHELKNPLATIHLTLGLLSESDEIMQLATKAIQDIQALIARCLEYEKLKDEKVIICLETHNLFNQFQQIAQNTKSAERLTIDVNSTWTLETDGQLLYSVLFNLIDNALKYSPPNSLISIVAQKEETDFFITVQNKIGMADVPDKSKVFEKYYRNKAAHHEIGSGLGLYLVKTMTNLLGGDIIYSHNETDVFFNLRLPFSINL